VPLLRRECGRDWCDVTEPTWQMLLQLGALGPIIWLLYRMIPVLAKVGEAFTRLEVRIETHCAEQAELMRQHDERAAHGRAEQQEWMRYLLQRLNGRDSPAAGS